MGVERRCLALVIGHQTGLPEPRYPLEKPRDVLDVVEHLAGNDEIDRRGHILEREGERVADGKPAAVVYVSPKQIDILTPADTNTGPVNVIVTTNLYYRHHWW